MRSSGLTSAASSYRCWRCSLASKSSRSTPRWELVGYLKLGCNQQSGDASEVWEGGGKAGTHARTSPACALVLPKTLRTCCRRRCCCCHHVCRRCCRHLAHTSCCLMLSCRQLGASLSSPASHSTARTESCRVSWVSSQSKSSVECSVGVQRCSSSQLMKLLAS